MAEPKIDPVTLEILWSRLIAIAEEQSAIVIRTAFSNIVRESYDYTCVLLTPDGDLLAQPFQSLPGFTRCCSTVTKHFIARWPDWHPDDVAITNDPWLAAGHLHDVALAVPVFHKGKIVAFAVNIAHQADIGGRGYSADANSIFEDKSKRFTEQNLEGLGQILTPFRERLTEFKTRVEEMHHQDAQQQASLKTELTQLKELNRQMTEEAHSLATALKGQSKMQGNWGELVLENVLARSGLQADRDYRREVSFTTESGRQRPDVIVYLPQQKHLIIDAKVSLNAYTRYVNADDELDRKAALREHVQAVSDRITELADRRYFDLGELNSPDMVFMFIPIESAFVEAMRADEQLFQKALERNVLVATPTTLLTSLNIVRQLWRFEHQNAHSAELADSASQLYQKFLGFISSMEDLGRKLDSAKASYTTAYSQLYSGRGNLIKRAKDFERLGVAVQKELPQELVDKAELELDYLPSAEELSSDDKDRAA